MAGGHNPSFGKRRALHFNAFVEDIDKRKLWEMHDGLCGICKSYVPFGKTTIDHIIPLSRGGLHCYDNVQPAHASCNRRKADLLPHQFDPNKGNAKRVPGAKGYRNSRSERQARTHGRKRARPKK
jgi:5-methylcytosine-specific restriction endonuclease McrA